jgi:hypothetical protein
MAEDDRVGIRESRPQPLQASLRRTGVMDHGEEIDEHGALAEVAGVDDRLRTVPGNNGRVAG